MMGKVLPQIATTITIKNSAFKCLSIYYIFHYIHSTSFGTYIVLMFIYFIVKLIFYS